MYLIKCGSRSRVKDIISHTRHTHIIVTHETAETSSAYISSSFYFISLSLSLSLSLSHQFFFSVCVVVVGGVCVLFLYHTLLLPRKKIRNLINIFHFLKREEEEEREI